MRIALLIALLALPAAAAAADERDAREAFYGTWGTARQCARLPIKEGGTVLHEPVTIGPEWLQQGKIWCRLTWHPLHAREDGLYTGAFAQCGEDSVRGYLLRMGVSGEQMTLHWGAPLSYSPPSKGPLARCPVS